MSKDTESGEYIEMTGKVLSICRDKFEVEIDDNGMIVLCVCSGKMKISGIKILAGDSVKLLVSGYDPTKGRIIYREKA